MTHELDNAINVFHEQHAGLLDLVVLPKNEGLGSALAHGVPECRNEIIARMDSDDYSFSTRMEKELAVMSDYNLDMVGSQIVEFPFVQSPKNVRTLLPFEASHCLQIS